MTVTDPRSATSEAGQRLARLAALADRLCDATTVEDVAAAVTTAGADALEADAVTVFLRRDDGAALDLVGSAGVRPEMVDRFASVPADSPLPVVDAIRDRALVVIDGREDRERRYPAVGSGPITSESLVVAPMVVHQREVIGAMSVGFAARRVLDGDDLAFIQAATALCGQAVHRARLETLRRRAGVRNRVLAQATALLVADLEVEGTLARIAQGAVQGLADVCAVFLRDEHDAAVRPVAAAHAEPEGQRVVDQLVEREPVTRSRRLLEVIERGESVHVPVISPDDAEGDAEDDAHLALIRALDATSGVAVPMAARGQVLGLLLLLRTSSGAPLDQDDLGVAEELASRAALALDNARLHAEQVELVEHLQIALSSHRAIEQAKGVLAQRWAVTPGEAFERMRRAARSRRAGIEAVAEAVVAGTDDLG